MASPFSNLLFIPGLLKFTAGPGPRPSQPAAPSPQAYCPSTSRHALVTPPSPSLSGSARHANPPRGRRVAPQAVVTTAPPSSAGRSTLQPFNTLLPAPTILPPVTQPESVRVVGHKHTAESKRKISAANRGNIPWNKGRRHSEETKRKISEATRRAMLQPEMRRLLKERAKGRKHSEATKLKIRETARATRGGGSAAKKSKKLPVPFSFPPEVVADLNDKVQRQLESSYRMGDSQRLMVREKRAMPEETKAKLSARIKELWNDPEYRSKVAEGIEQRAMRLGREKSREESKSPESSQPDANGIVPLVSAKVKQEPTPSRRLRSPKRRARVKTSTSNAPGDHDDGEAAPLDEIDASEIFLDPTSLDGITKEDLGLCGTQVEGKVETGSSCNDAFMTDGESDEVQLRMVPDNARRDHNNLLASLAVAGQAQQLEDAGYLDVSKNHGGFGELNAEFHAEDVDPLNPAEASHAGQELAQGAALSGYTQDPARPEEALGFFDNPGGPMSSSATEPSPFVSVGSGGDEDRISPEVNTDFHFSSGGEHAVGQNSGSAYARDNLSLNYVDDNFGGLDIYDGAGTSLESALKAGPSIDFGRQSEHLAKHPGQGK